MQMVAIIIEKRVSFIVTLRLRLSVRVFQKVMAQAVYISQIARLQAAQGIGTFYAVRQNMASILIEIRTELPVKGNCVSADDLTRD